MNTVNQTAKKLSGLALASAAATLLLAGCGGNTESKTSSEKAAPAMDAQQAKEAKVKCSGINACKGKSACATATSACSGQNSCKGKGWIYVPSKEECDSKGGKVI